MKNDSSKFKKRGTILLLVAIVAVTGGYFGWRRISGADQGTGDPINMSEPVPERNTSGPKHPLDPTLDLAYEQRDKILTDIRDYTATMIQRYGDTKKYGPGKTMFLKIRHEVKKDGKIVTPFSVYMRFEAPDAVKGREVIWVNGRNKNRLIAHEVGFKNIMRFNLAPTSMLAMMGNRYPITEIGIAKMVDKLIIRGEKEKQWEDCEVTITKGVEFRGRKCKLIEVRHPNKADHFDFMVAKIHVDEEYHLPIHYAAYKWPKEDGGEPVLDEEFIYDDLKINVGLKDIDFDPDNEAYDYP